MNKTIAFVEVAISTGWKYINPGASFNIKTPSYQYMGSNDIA